MSSSLIDNTAQKAGITDLAANSNAGSVLFVTPFPAAPYWADAPLVIPATGQGAVTATIRSFDQYGFSYTLSGKPPTSGYTLRWRFIASLADAFDFPDDPTGVWTWAEFIDQVIRRITDSQPNEASFTEAQTEYVRARLALLKGDAASYQIHQNRYTSMRRKLAGFQTGMSPAQQQAAVRSLLTQATANDALFVQAASLYVKAQLARDANMDGGQSKEYLEDYNDLRNSRLLGYTYTQNDATLLAAVIGTFFVTTPVTQNTAYLTYQVAAARTDLETQAAWFNAQIAASANDLGGLYDRVVKEIRAAAIAIQQVVEGYRAGHITTYDDSNTTVNGFAALGTMPVPGAQIRDAWMLFPPPAVRIVNPGMLTEGTNGGIARGDLDWLMTDTMICRRKQCVGVPWEQRLDAMVGRQTSWPLLAVQGPAATTFMVAGQLQAASRVLELTWDGLRLDFSLGDLVPFDEGAAQCAAFFVQRELAMEFADPPATVTGYNDRFMRRQAELYVEFQDRGQMKLPRSRSGGWPSAHRHQWNGQEVMGVDTCSAARAAALPTDGSSFWPQLLDATTGTWNLFWFINGNFTASPQDWRNTPASLLARVSTGFLQLWDTQTLAWRSIWWADGILTAGPADNSTTDGQPATAVRINVLNGVTTLQLADSAHAGQWRALCLSNGAPIAGPLVAT